MADVTISYNGNEIASMSATGTKTLLTEAKYCEDDITIDYVKPSAPAPNLQAKSNISPTLSSQTVTADAGYDGLSSVQINAMPSGSATTPATTITANPSISVNLFGEITASVSKSQKVTPTVSAGYVSSGTYGTVTVSGSSTEQLTTKAAQTYTPTTTNQTIAAGQYLTGTQTILGDANLVAENIKKDVSIFSVVGSYEGGGGGVGEVTFEGTLAITNTTNLWQYVDDDPSTSAYIITLRDLYVNNHYMNFMSEWTLFSDVTQAIDMPLFIHVRDGNDDYDYDIYLQMNPVSQVTYIYGGSSLRANVKKIVKVAM